MEEVTLPRELAVRLLEHIESLQDEGPVGEGWQSDNLVADIEALKTAISRSNTRRERPTLAHERHD